jgi:nucleoside-diphosphate-sugar epimerase
MGVYYPDNEKSRSQHQMNIRVPAATPEDKGYLTSSTYQYVDARDIPIFIKLAIEAENLQPFEAFFVGTDTTYNEPTSIIVPRRWPFLAKKAKDIPGFEGLISTKKAERLLGFKPEHSWRNQS